MIANYHLLFFLAVCCTSFAAAQNSSTFHHFWLVQTWPYGYCSDKFSSCNNPQLPSTFVLHGLWPTDINGSTINLPKSNGLAVVQSLLKTNSTLKGQLERYWPSLSKANKSDYPSFWGHEWDKHGKAQSLYIQAEDYFQKTIELMMNADILSALRSAGIVANDTSYPKVNYKNAIKAITGSVDVVLKCVKKPNGDKLLKEVYLCVDGKAKKFIACNSERIAAGELFWKEY